MNPPPVDEGTPETALSATLAAWTHPVVVVSTPDISNGSQGRSACEEVA